MDAPKLLLASLPLVLACPAVGLAQQMRCDCTSVVNSCSADVTAKGSYLEIKTNQQQCARVDYFVDGMPFVSVVVDGEDRQDWPARTASPKILVQSCQVCRDNGAAVPALRSSAPARPTASPASDANADDKKLVPLIAGQPQYPAAARQRGVEGWVDVEHTVNAQGNVEEPHVVASQPKGVFDAAALAAVARWRYPAAADRAPQTITSRVEFKPDRTAATAAAGVGESAGPRNQCLREDAVYNYGESIDVGLINACAEPLVVFGCALGTGRYAGRWLCSDSEQQGNVLVAQNDRRLGTRYAAGDSDSVRTYTYTDQFSVTRAPNSPYWWIACAEQDTTCRADGRQWVRSVGGQPSTVDPQDRSVVALARSN